MRWSHCSPPHAPQPGSSRVQGVRVQGFSENSNGAGCLSVLVSTSLMRCWCELKGLRFPELSSPRGQLVLLTWKLKASEFFIDPGAQVYLAGNPSRDFRYALTAGGVCKQGSCFLGPLCWEPRDCPQIPGCRSPPPVRRPQDRGKGGTQTEGCRALASPPHRAGVRLVCCFRNSHEGVQ